MILYSYFKDVERFSSIVSSKFAMTKQCDVTPGVGNYNIIHDNWCRQESFLVPNVYLLATMKKQWNKDKKKKNWLVSRVLSAGND